MGGPLSGSEARAKAKAAVSGPAADRSARLAAVPSSKFEPSAHTSATSRRSTVFSLGCCRCRRQTIEWTRLLSDRPRDHGARARVCLLVPFAFAFAFEASFWLATDGRAAALGGFLWSRPIAGGARTARRRPRRRHISPNQLIAVIVVIVVVMEARGRQDLVALISRSPDSRAHSSSVRPPKSADSPAQPNSSWRTKLARAKR